MCGIAGIVDFQEKINGRQVTEQMLSAISYRGPDESGIYATKYATLGNVRLSIIDIEGGKQPLTDVTSRYWLTFNGEIFNYRELRSDLEKRGVVFRTHSDTEVLIELYAEHGKDCLRYLNGQFAFAIWDKHKEELFFARDRIGIRPFFYNIHDGAFSFASEIKSLFRNDRIPREIDAKNLLQVYTFWTTVTPHTAFKNIFELSPGNYGHYSRKGLSISKYWELNFEPNCEPLNLSDAMEKFHEIFSDAVRIRLRADVEVAAYLSGGIDSSATVAYIKNIEPGVLNTFSIGFREKSFDESHYQQKAVKYFETRHNSYICTSREIAESFPKVIWHSEIPLTRTAPSPMLLLSKLVRDHNIKVVVTGEGSDELLAGYDIFKETAIRQFWASQPDSAFRPLLLKRLYPYIPQITNSSIATIKLFFGYRLGDVSNPFYSHLIRWNNSNYIRKHFSEEMKLVLGDNNPIDNLRENLPSGFESWNPLARAQWLETTVFMSGYLLSSQGDRMSMANSVEGRYPFLDYRLIEFCNSLQSNLKLKGLTEKYLLKKLLKDKIPAEIINRTKQPYRAPVNNVFMGDESPEYVTEMLSEKYIKKAAIFDHTTIFSALSKIRKTGTSSEMDDMLLTAIISTHLLYYQFIENRNENFIVPKLNKLRIIEDF
jgi:asparagine synthase (glutamine-hydrolysing)